MTATLPAFRFTPAVRERASLLIAIAGASGSGKTRSGLEVARGLAGGDDTRIAVIDTERGRALHYAVGRGEQPGPGRFAFNHCELRPPFSPDIYMAAIAAADEAGFEVIMIDSCSHEWEGEGGVRDIHDALVVAEIEKARKRHNPSWGEFDEAKATEKAALGAWRDPKLRHKRFVNRLLQCGAHLVLCLRADEKIRIEKVKDDRGREKTVIVQPKDMDPRDRWQPICEKRFMYEMTLSFVLSPSAPGVPIPVKLQAQHQDAVPLNRPLSEATGRALAAWAAGGTQSPPSPSSPASGGEGQSYKIPPPQSGEMPAPSSQAPSTEGGTGNDGPDESEIMRGHDEALTRAAEKGTAALIEAWAKVPAPYQHKLTAAKDRRYKPAALKADEDARKKQDATQSNLDGAHVDGSTG